MELKNKIIAGVTILGIAASAVGFSVKGTCIDANGLTMFPKEIVTMREKKGEKVVEVGKLCFKQTKDYETVAKDRIDTYLSLKDGMEKREYISTEDGALLDDILTHEIEKREGGKIALDGVKKGDDLALKIIEFLQNNPN